jgi:hypothetical protein
MRKMRLFYQICTILILCGCLNACFKPKKALIDQETKDYCLFAEGSYWIYQDSATLKMDSVVIGGPPIRGSYENGGYDCEEYGLLVLSYSPDSTLRFAPRLTTGRTAPYVLLIDYPWGEAYYHNGALGKKLEYLVLSENRSNYVVNGITYSNIKIFEFKYSFESPKKINYWAKHVGIIRQEIYTTDSVTVRNLIKYNVKPYKK